ncbi:ATP synthase F0 subunit A [bacterium]|nr:MAG: ATP synthase F0 subunit A [bacterium]
MAQILRKFALTLTVIAVSYSLANAAEESNKVDVLGKLQNHSYLDFKPFGKVELPLIFKDHDGWRFYPSTTAAINSGDGYTDEHYLLHPDQPKKIENGIVKPIAYHLVREDGGHIEYNFSISSHLTFFLLSGFVLAFIAFPLKSKYVAGIGRTTEPKGTFQNMFEALILFVRDELARPNIGEKKYLKFTPYLLTAFFMILFMNLFGLMPFGVSSTADVTITAALAVTTFLITQLSASKDHWKHIFWFPGVPVPIKLILLPVELVGLVTKPFALAIRLFANMASGKVLVYSIIGLIFVFAGLFGDAVAYGTSPIIIGFALFIFVIKVVVSFLQAYIFTMLSALFIGMAVAEHDHDHEHEHH